MFPAPIIVGCDVPICTRNVPTDSIWSAHRKRKSRCFHLYGNSASVQNLNFDDIYVYSRKIKSLSCKIIFHIDGFTDN